VIEDRRSQPHKEGLYNRRVPIVPGGNVTDRAGVHLRRVRALDGLRGIAVIAVLLFHDQRLKGGYLGVDLFFVLSGFLITSLLLVEFEQHGRISLPRFYARRARRLLPALGLALFGVAIYAAVWARPTELPRIRWDGIATLFYAQNWREIVTKRSYWDAFTAPSALQHAWSLSIEEQFYAIWPLIVIGVLAIRRSVRAVLTTTLVLGAACATFAVVTALRGGDQRLLYYSTMSRAPALLMGAALAALLAIRGPVRSRRDRVALEVAAIMGAAYIAWEWAHQPGDGLSLYRGPLLLSGVAAVAVIAAAAHPERGLVARVLAVPPLVGVGLISYGLYLFHWPVYLVLTPSRTNLSGWGLFAERVGVSLAIAIASYFLVEQPIRRGALRPTRAVIAFGVATALIATSLVVTTHATSTSTPLATNGTSNGDFLPPGDASQLTNLCNSEQAPPVLNAPTAAAPKILVEGDSVACFVGAALEINQAAEGVTVRNRSRLDCPLGSPVRINYPGDSSNPPRACADNESAALAALDPDVVVLYVGGPEGFGYDLGDGRWRGPCDASFDSWYEAAARRSIRELSANGATVVVVTMVHRPPADFGSDFKPPKDDNRHVDCDNRMLRAAVAAEPHARLLDLDSYICPAGHCRPSIDGITLRTDGVHFLKDGAVVVAAWLLPKVLALADLHPRGSS
jgi:peptidoglycan/LPS O-acetylase OafA/YrhL